MTYSSRNFLISWGVGSEERVPRFSNRLSSAMMSLQTSTHSSQMKTVGPAISFRTSFWSLLQKEHRRTSVSPAFFTIYSPKLFACRPLQHPSGSFADDIVNDTVFLAFVRRHDVVALGIILNALHGLSRVVDQDLMDSPTHPQDLGG